MPVQEFDQYALNYSKDIEDTLGVFGKGHDFYVRSKAEILNGLFRSIETDNGGIKVLDVGCGVGLVHPLIVGSVDELHGVDVSEDSIDVARRDNVGVSYKSYQGGSLPYEDDSFDCAYAICVLHHVPVAEWPSFAQRDGARGEAWRHRGLHRAQSVPSGDPMGREQLPDRQGRCPCEAIRLRR